jgi:uncharacterized protein (DUF4415 family)
MQMKRVIDTALIAPPASKDKSMAQTPRRPVNPKDAAEALFRPVKKAAPPAIERTALPNTKELVSIKIDSDVIAHFQAGGPGWQDRINATLRAAVDRAS